MDDCFAALRKITRVNAERLNILHELRGFGLAALVSLPDVHSPDAAWKVAADILVNDRVFLGIIAQQDKLQLRVKLNNVMDLTKLVIVRAGTRHDEIIQSRF